MKIWIASLCLILLNIASLKSQNLVPNAGFEEIEQSTIWQGGFADGVIDWEGYLTCDIHFMDYGAAGMNVPTAGYQPPLEGQAMAGIRAFDFREEEWHEFIYTKLTDTLEAGELYYISFWVSPSEAPKYVTDDIGLAFSNVEPTDEVAFFYQLTPAIKNPEGNFISDVTSWHKISGHYKAKGGETHLVIGNFIPDEESSFKESGSGEKAAYFFIDQVVVEKCPIPICLNLTDTVLCGQEILNLDVTTPEASYLWSDGSVLNTFKIEKTGKYWVEISAGGCSASDTINVLQIPQVYLGEDTVLCIGEELAVFADLSGASYKWSNGAITDSILVTGESGKYSVRVEKENCIFFDTIAINYLEDYIVIYPNPNRGTFNIDTKLLPIDRVEIYDISGRLLFDFVEENSGAILLELEKVLSSGVYIVKVSSAMCTYTQKIVVTTRD